MNPLSIKNTEEAEEIAKKFLFKRWGYSGITIESVGFDGNYFYVHGYNEESGSSSDEEKTRFVLKVKIDGNVVGWKLT